MAGIHRLLDQQAILHQGNVVIVVAGMDGVLPSVVGGLIDRPIVAVPTSQGYGANFGGLAPLLTMLNACSAGIGVVNIDIIQCRHMTPHHLCGDSGFLRHRNI